MLKYNILALNHWYEDFKQIFISILSIWDLNFILNIDSQFKSPWKKQIGLDTFVPYAIYERYATS